MLKKILIFVCAAALLLVGTGTIAFADDAPANGGLPQLEPGYHWGGKCEWDAMSKIYRNRERIYDGKTSMPTPPAATTSTPWVADRCQGGFYHAASYGMACSLDDPRPPVYGYYPPCCYAYGPHWALGMYGRGWNLLIGQ